MDASALPPEGLADGAFIVPPVTDDNYIVTLLRLCKDYRIDILMPTATLELELMAEHKKLFEENGIKVAVSSFESLEVANNKVALYDKYNEYMPTEIVTSNPKEAELFYNAVGGDGNMCCKLANLCGGKGFAIVDNTQCYNVSLFGKYGVPRYLSLKDLQHILTNGTEVILQRHIKGNDYSVSVLADHGKILRIVGYVGYTMCFGSIMYGEIKKNDSAYALTEKIVADLQLDGNVAFDFIIKEDGTAVLLECNPRVNASISFVKEAGSNLIYLRCLQLLGYPIPQDYSVQYGLKMKKVYESRYYV